MTTSDAPDETDDESEERIAELESELAARDAEIERFEDTIADLSAEIVELERTRTAGPSESSLLPTHIKRSLVAATGTTLYFIIMMLLAFGLLLYLL